MTDDDILRTLDGMLLSLILVISQDLSISNTKEAKEWLAKALSFCSK